jgi:hypothetical protein
VRPRHPQSAACRAEQLLRLRKELSFIVIAGWHADTALWHQQTAATPHAQRQAQGQQRQEQNQGEQGGETLQVSGNSSNDAATQPSKAAQLGGTSSGGAAGRTESAAGFLAAALEGSSNSSRLEAKLAVSGAWPFAAHPSARCPALPLHFCSQPSRPHMAPAGSQAR